MDRPHSSVDDYDNDDLITFEISSKTISFNYSQLTRYSKHIRDEYRFSEVINIFPQELQKIQEEFQLLADNITVFFQLLQQNCNIKENSKLTYVQCNDLLKMSKYLEVRKLSDQINGYIKRQNLNIDFIIQMIQYEHQKCKNSDKYDINSEYEDFLSSKINECISNEKFSELPISNIFRIFNRSASNDIKSDELFDFIKKSISKFCVLFQFLELQQLSEDRFDELFELYSNSESKFFSYMKFDLNFIKNMKDQKKQLQKQLKSTEKLNDEQRYNMNELETEMKEIHDQLKNSEKEKNQLKIQLNKSEKTKIQIEQENKKIQKQLEDSELMNNQKNNELELLKSQIIEIQKKFEQSEKEKSEFKKQLEDFNCQIMGQIEASVKDGLLVSAQIKLASSGSSLDTKRSKYIISTSNAKKVGNESYEKGEPITSLNMITSEYLCKSGTYYVRCLVFDCDGKFKEIVSNPVTTSGDSFLFNYEGKGRKISLLKGQYKFEVWGAQGGDSTGRSDRTVLGGLGGYSVGHLCFQKNEVIHVYVGGSGQPSNSSEGATTNGGFPDGGGTRTGHYSGYKSVPGTGGGSSSIRIGSGSVLSRVIVAGGGGGASGEYCSNSPGGFGGGTSGGNCYYSSSLQNEGSGTQAGSTGGKGSESNGDPGEFGKGAACKYKSGSDSGGGGGGGWYGGGGGGVASGSSSSSGGGGSGWIFTESSFRAWSSGDSATASSFTLNSSYYLTNALTVSGDSDFPRPDGCGNEHGHKGNGYARITPE